MSEVVSWMIELVVKPNKLADLRTLTREMVEETRTEGGVAVYERYIAGDHTMHLYERYIDSGAAVAHLRTFESLFADRLLALVNRRRVVVYGPVSAELKAILDSIGAEYFEYLAGFSR
jgi:quinol monooxygenase YgiN